MWYLCILCRTKWIQIRGSRYSVGCIVLNSEPVFGQIVDILLTAVDMCLLVCEVLTTDGYVEHFHAFEVSKETPTPLAFCSPQELADYHILGLYKLNHAMYVVPKYHIGE